jgi:ribosome maturation factor RimP
VDDAGVTLAVESRGKPGAKKRPPTPRQVAWGELGAGRVQVEFGRAEAAPEDIDEDIDDDEDIADEDIADEDIADEDIDDDVVLEDDTEHGDSSQVRGGGQ